MQHLCFSDYAFDRNALKRDDQQWIDAQLDEDNSQFLIFSNQSFVVDEHDIIVFMNKNQINKFGVTNAQWKYLGQNSQSQPVFCAEIEECTETLQWKNLRAIGLKQSPEVANIIIYAQGLLNWHRHNKFCNRCGSVLSTQQAGHLKKCTQSECGIEIFPRTDPAVIILIYNGDACLLGRAAYWPENMYSCLAGFVETGEDLEMGVAREIFEEAGLRVSNIEYRGSQPWPFPQSIMCGFLAQSLDRDLIFHDNELEDARWYNRQQLIAAIKTGDLKLPSTMSISYSLIEDWFNRDCSSTLKQLL